MDCDVAMADSCISPRRRKRDEEDGSSGKPLDSPIHPTRSAATKSSVVLAKCSSSTCNVAIVLPRDIIDPIISRLPVKSLLRFRSVCKSWCHLIDDPTFALYHVNQLNASHRPDVSILFIDQLLNASKSSKLTHDSVFLRSLDENTSKTISLHEFSVGPISSNTRPSIHGVCNGLICYSIHPSKVFNDCDLYLCNPFKRDALELELPHRTTPSHFHPSYGFGVDSTTNSYKIVRVYKDNNVDPPKAEVHTLGTKIWRKLEEYNNPPCPISDVPIFANGNFLYWSLCRLGKQVDAKQGIVTFDLKNEVFYLTPMPNLGIACYHLFNLQGCLGLFDESSDKFGEIWLLKDKFEWVKMYKLKITFFTSSNIEVLGMWNDADLLIKSSSSSLVSYNTKTDQWRRLVIYDMYKYSRNIVAFERSLILPSNLNKY